MAGRADAVAAAAFRAGFRGGGLVTATAVALAESGGIANAIGDGGDSIGPWQINMPSHPQWSRSWLLDIDNNAKAAFEVSGGGKNFNPWTMYRNGRYRSFVDEANKAAQHAQQNPGYDPTPDQGSGPVDAAKDAASAVLNPILGPLEALAKVAAALLDPKAWLLRLLEVVGGAVMIAAGALLVSKDLAPDVAKLAGVIPGAGKLAAAAAAAA